MGKETISMERNRTYQLLKPLTTLLRLFSMLPLHLSPPLSLLYATLLLSLYVANVVLSFVTMETQSASLLALLIRYLISGLSTIFVLVTVYKGQASERILMKLIAEIDEMGQPISLGGSRRRAQLYRPDYRALRTRVLVSCSAFLLVTLISFATLHRVLQGLNMFKIINFLVPNTCSLLMCLQFYLLLSFVQKRLESIYQYFLRSTWATLTTSLSVQKKIIQMDVKSPRGSTLSFHQDSLLLSDTPRFVTRHICASHLRAELVYFLKTFYTIFRLCERISTMFEAQILLALIIIHVLLTCILYVMTHTVLSYLSATRPLDARTVGANVYWFLFYWVTVGLIVVPCETIVTLKMKILETVHQLIIEDKMPQLTLELEMFLIDLQNYKIQFTAHGFFSLEYSLFRKIMGAVFTYWILLIQFP